MPQKELYIDIETVRGFKTLYDLFNHNPDLSNLWIKKYHPRFDKDGDKSPEETYAEKAGLFEPFAKIVCITIGGNNGKVKSFYNHDEAQLLTDFNVYLKAYKGYEIIYVGHNILEFDIPFIGVRMLIQGIKPHKSLDIRGKKPWQINHIDTMSLFGFGRWKYRISLDVAVTVFGIPSPKQGNVDGAMVGEHYWGYEKDGVVIGGGDVGLSDIVSYCERDVLCLIPLKKKLTI